MLSKEDFIERAFSLAKAMMCEPEWALHIDGVDDRFIRFKNGKNVDAGKLEKMWPMLLEAELTAASANPIISVATKNQGCVNVPMVEIARRMRAE